MRAIPGEDTNNTFEWMYSGVLLRSYVLATWRNLQSDLRNI